MTHRKSSCDRKKCPKSCARGANSTGGLLPRRPHQLRDHLHRERKRELPHQICPPPRREPIDQLMHHHLDQLRADPESCTREMLSCGSSPIVVGRWRGDWRSPIDYQQPLAPTALTWARCGSTPSMRIPRAARPDRGRTPCASCFTGAPFLRRVGALRWECGHSADVGKWFR
jgi:hypothetical protein